ncbi:TonB-dependent receptor plug domain-containing protein [Dongshaea marina]|uniref:TonB-dependent receptor plug domain-containing protein n=1 Tax=Dongshaea marina TaxID=2047966 RepID=UPI000D3EA439|nr:TonB-dependent receptor plug domain-containing protein [Dongshaea marina]
MNTRLSLLALAVASSLPLVAQAQSDTTQPSEIVANTGKHQAQSDATKLNEVIVSAVRQNHSDAQPTQSTVVVDQQKLEQSQADSVAEAISGAPNISTSGGPRSSAQAPVIRGLTGDRILQVIDGARQDFSSGHRGSYFIDPELLKSAVIIKGPSSSLWGSGALGGAVIMQTKDASDLLKDGQKLGGSVSGGWHSNDDSWLSSASVYGKSDSGVDFLLNGYGRDSQDIKLGDGSSLDNSALRRKGACLSWAVTLAWGSGWRGAFASQSKVEVCRATRQKMSAWKTRW